MLHPGLAFRIRRAVEALKTLGYRPRAPLDFDDFVDRLKRQQWAQDKNMTVFSLFSDVPQATEVDLCIEPPIDLEAAYRRALHQEVAPGTMATFCSLEDLIELKSLRGRPEDRDDIAKLRELRKDNRE